MTPDRFFSLWDGLLPKLPVTYVEVIGSDRANGFPQKPIVGIKLNGHKEYAWRGPMAFQDALRWASIERGKKDGRGQKDELHRNRPGDVVRNN